ncbi:MAG TPA: hypothetical protein VD994_18545 [Prosthecobacter sp.]|nr:hypothetical protein [Prosthecobacter sp.]
MPNPILYDPLPIGRIGVVRRTEEVVLAHDFSAFGFMAEEFIAHAVTEIAIPASAPESSVISSMPAMLRRRFRLIDDSAELHSVQRVLAPICEELEIVFEPSRNQLKFPPRMDGKIRSEFACLHENLIRMALGFNHKVQVSLKPDHVIRRLRSLRQTLRDPAGRFIVAQIEALLGSYVTLEIPTLSVGQGPPAELISVFDRLLNDEHYLSLCEASSGLSLPKTRNAALSRMREMIRFCIASSPIGSSWNIAVRLVNAWKGIELPTADELAGIVVPRNLPLIVDTYPARQAALKCWMTSDCTMMPCDRSGNPIDVDVDWLPPLKSMKLAESGACGVTLGTAGELKGALELMVKRIETPRRSADRRKKRR